MSFNDHDHRGEFADARHDHDNEYAERYHRHHDLETEQERLQGGLREAMAETGQLRSDHDGELAALQAHLAAALKRIGELEKTAAAMREAWG